MKWLKDNFKYIISLTLVAIIVFGDVFNLANIVMNSDMMIGKNEDEITTEDLGEDEEETEEPDKDEEETDEPGEDEEETDEPGEDEEETDEPGEDEEETDEPGEDEEETDEPGEDEEETEEPSEEEEETEESGEEEEETEEFIGNRYYNPIIELTEYEKIKEESKRVRGEFDDALVYKIFHEYKYSKTGRTFYIDEFGDILSKDLRWNYSKDDWAENHYIFGGTYSPAIKDDNELLGYKFGSEVSESEADGYVITGTGTSGYPSNANMRVDSYTKYNNNIGENEFIVYPEDPDIYIDKEKYNGGNIRRLRRKYRGKKVLGISTSSSHTFSTGILQVPKEIEFIGYKGGIRTSTAEGSEIHYMENRDKLILQQDSTYALGDFWTSAHRIDSIGKLDVIGMKDANTVADRARNELAICYLTREIEIKNLGSLQDTLENIATFGAGRNYFRSFKVHNMTGDFELHPGPLIRDDSSYIEKYGNVTFIKRTDASKTFPAWKLIDFASDGTIDGNFNFNSYDSNYFSDSSNPVRFTALEEMLFPDKVKGDFLIGGPLLRTAGNRNILEISLPNEAKTIGIGGKGNKQIVKEKLRISKLSDRERKNEGISDEAYIEAKELFKDKDDYSIMLDPSHFNQRMDLYGPMFKESTIEIRNFKNEEDYKPVKGDLNIGVESLANYNDNVILKNIDGDILLAENIAGYNNKLKLNEINNVSGDVILLGPRIPINRKDNNKELKFTISDIGSAKDKSKVFLLHGQGDGSLDFRFDETKEYINSAEGEKVNDFKGGLFKRGANTRDYLSTFELKNMRADVEYQTIDKGYTDQSGEYTIDRLKLNNYDGDFKYFGESSKEEKDEIEYLMNGHKDGIILEIANMDNEFIIPKFSNLAKSGVIEVDINNTGKNGIVRLKGGVDYDTTEGKQLSIKADEDNKGDIIIDDGVFYDRNIKNLSIETEGNVHIGKRAFENITRINQKDDIYNLKIHGGKGVTIDKEAFRNVKIGTMDIESDNGEVLIAANAFDDSKKQTKNIKEKAKINGKSVVIESEAFLGTEIGNLEIGNGLSENLLENEEKSVDRKIIIETDAFKDVDIGSLDIKTEVGNIDIHQHAFQNISRNRTENDATAVNIKGSKEVNIAEEAFHDANISDLSIISLEEKLTMGERAFESNNEANRSIKIDLIGENGVDVDTHVFRNRNVSNLNIRAGDIFNIGIDNEVEIKKEVNIKERAFENISLNVKNVNIKAEDGTRYGKRSFYNTNLFTDIEETSGEVFDYVQKFLIGSNVKEIKKEAFAENDIKDPTLVFLEGFRISVLQGENIFGNPNVENIEIPYQKQERYDRRRSGNIDEDIVLKLDSFFKTGEESKLEKIVVYDKDIVIEKDMSNENMPKNLEFVGPKGLNRNQNPEDLIPTKLYNSYKGLFGDMDKNNKTENNSKTTEFNRVADIKRMVNILEDGTTYGLYNEDNKPIGDDGEETDKIRLDELGNEEIVADNQHYLILEVKLNDLYENNGVFSRTHQRSVNLEIQDLHQNLQYDTNNIKILPEELNLEGLKDNNKKIAEEVNAKFDSASNANDSSINTEIIDKNSKSDRVSLILSSENDNRDYKVANESGIISIRIPMKLSDDWDTDVEETAEIDLDEDAGASKVNAYFKRDYNDNNIEISRDTRIDSSYSNDIFLLPGDLLVNVIKENIYDGDRLASLYDLNEKYRVGIGDSVDIKDIKIRKSESELVEYEKQPGYERVTKSISTDLLRRRGQEFIYKYRKGPEFPGSLRNAQYSIGYIYYPKGPDSMPIEFRDRDVGTKPKGSYHYPDLYLKDGYTERENGKEDGKPLAVYMPTKKTLEDDIFIKLGTGLDPLDTLVKDYEYKRISLVEEEILKSYKINYIYEDLDSCENIELRNPETGKAPVGHRLLPKLYEDGIGNNGKTYQPKDIRRGNGEYKSREDYEFIIEEDINEFTIRYKKYRNSNKEGITNSGGSGGGKEKAEEITDKTEDTKVIETPDRVKAEPNLNQTRAHSVATSSPSVSYITGYEDGTIRPEASVPREEVAAVAYRILDEDFLEKVKTTEHNFPDVKRDYWSEKYIATLEKAEIIEGYKDGSYQPRKEVTRGELATILARITGLEEKEDNAFKDIEGHWAEGIINAVAEECWINGYEDGSFAPDKQVTRAEMVTMINRMLEKDEVENKEEMKDFKDLLETEWYYEEIKKAI